MIVYNISTKVDWSIHEEWVVWQQALNIPAMLATGLFEECKIYRILEQDDAEGPLFTIQYYIKDMSYYQEYIEEFAPAFRRQAAEKWGDRFLSFHTLMTDVLAVH